MNTETYDAIIAKLNEAQEALNSVVKVLYAGVAVGDASETPLMIAISRIGDAFELLDDVELLEE